MTEESSSPPPSNVKNDLIDTYFSDTRRRFQRRKYVLKGIDDLIQADLLDMSKHAKFNSNYNYILVAINCFTKFAYGEPLKTKTAKEVTAAMQKILDRVYPMVKNLQVDRGTEFYNHQFKALMSKYKINLYSVYTEIKASMIERWNRTIRKLLIKETYKRNSPRWVDFLQDVITIYNNTIHSVTKMKPSEVTFLNEKAVFNRLMPIQNIRKNKNKRAKFKVGDLVHISKQKTLFEKGNFNYTPLVFEIRKVVFDDTPITYRLKDTEGAKEDIQGTFYAEELKKAKHGLTYVVEKVLKTKKVKNKSPLIFVKWLGFDDPKYNSWIPKSNVVV